jgi:DNA-directed RNA polymerase subunit F
MSPKILSEKAIPLETVKDLLNKRSEIADLNYIQRITLDFGHRFSESFPKSELLVDLLGHNYNLTREESIQIININPETIDELNLVLEDKLTTEEKGLILENIKSHKQQHQVTSEDKVPSDISSSSFDSDNGKEDYPDKEPANLEKD